MRNTNNELRNHIIYEFYAGLPNRENILMETRGVVSGLHDVVKAICEELSDQVWETYNTKEEETRVYSGEVSEFGLKSFFDDFNITLTTIYGNNKSTYRGGLSVSKSFSDSENGVVCSPVINFYVTDNDPHDMARTIAFSIGHELTHAYNFYQYARKNNLTVRQMMDNFDNIQRYGDIMAAKNSPGLNNERAVGDILYKLNRMERNAYIAQLKQELESEADYIVDSKSAWNAVLKSESYKKFKSLEKNFSIMFGPEISDEAKKQIVHYTNRSTGKNFKNFDQVKKYYMKYWETWKKKYLTTASKIAYEIYAEHNPITDGNMSDDILLKP